jgi:2-haloalkanoic acid dehalogenase type II
MARLGDFEVLTFDCYGTLIDWETGIHQALAPWLEAQGAGATRDRILDAFAKAEAPQQEATPGLRYPELLARVHAKVAAQLGAAPDPEAAAAFGRSVADWPAFSDSAAALAYLKRHYRLVILSNVDRTSFAHSNRRLGVEFDAVYTAEDIGSYKPSARNFEYMIEHLGQLGLAPSDILHTAESLFHDHVPAKTHHLATCWIYRRHAQQGFGATMDPGTRPDTDFRFNSMAELAAAHQREIEADL